MSKLRVPTRAIACALVLLAIPCVAPAAHAAAARVASGTSAAVSRGDLTGTVTDSASHQPLASAEVSVMQGDRIVLNTITDAFGRYVAHELPAGTYSVSARLLGFRAKSREVIVGGSAGDIRTDFQLTAVALNLSALSVTAAIPLAVDTRSGDQRFKQDSYHGAPTNTTSQIIQQSIAGAARAPTGEVHIRGQHAEYSYYVDGVPVPSGISGSLNELFDPAIVNTINFQTGGWDAEYGNKNSAIINVTTRIPTGGFHMNASGFGGSFGTSGQSLNASTNSGKWGFFGSLSRQVTDMRLEPVQFDTTTFKAYNYHNHGEDIYGFAKVQYNASTNDVVNFEGSWSRTKFQVPFDSTGGNSADDN